MYKEAFCFSFLYNFIASKQVDTVVKPQSCRFRRVCFPPLYLSLLYIDVNLLYFCLNSWLFVSINLKFYPATHDFLLASAHTHRDMNIVSGRKEEEEKKKTTETKLVSIIKKKKKTLLEHSLDIVQDKRESATLSYIHKNNINRINCLSF